MGIETKYLLGHSTEEKKSQAWGLVNDERVLIVRFMNWLFWTVCFNEPLPKKQINSVIFVHN